MTTRQDEALERLEAVIAAWGADPDGWPEADRRLLEMEGVSEMLAGRLAEEAAFDALLRDLPEAPPFPDQVESAVLAAGANIAAARSAGGTSWMLRLRSTLENALGADVFAPGRLAGAGAAFAAAVVIGAGLGQVAPATQTAPEDAFSALAASDPFLGLEAGLTELEAS